MKKTVWIVLLTALSILTLFISVSAQNQRQIIMVSTSAVTDRGWGNGCSRMAAQAAAAVDWKLLLWDRIAPEEAADRIAYAAASGADLVLIPDPELKEAMLQVAAQYPSTVFALLRDSENAPAQAFAGNVSALRVNEAQEGLLAGIMAAELTTSGKVGFLFSDKPEGEDALYRSFSDTIQKLNKQNNSNITVSEPLYVNGNAEQKAFPQLIDPLLLGGTDVIFTDDSEISMLTARAAESFNAMGSGKTVSVITRSFPSLIRSDSVVMNLNSGIARFLEELMRSIENGTYQGGLIEANLENGFLGADFNESLPPRAAEKFNLDLRDALN